LIRPRSRTSSTRSATRPRVVRRGVGLDRSVDEEGDRLVSVSAIGRGASQVVGLAAELAGNRD
jgi:hypothetical protein